MSKQPNKTLIGMFVTGAITLLILAIAIFGSSTFFQKTISFVMFFERSISGLAEGSPVMFMGVPIGKVVRIQVDSDGNNMNFTIPVYIELYKNTHTIFIKQQLEQSSNTDYLNTLIKKGLRGNLAQQSFLTGQLMIELSFANPNTEENPFITQMTYYKGTPVIPTIPSPLDNVWKELTQLPLKEISNNLITLTTGLNKLLNAPDSPPLATDIATLTQEATQMLLVIKNISTKYEKLIETTNAQLFLALKETTNVAKNINDTNERLFGENSPTLIGINQALRDFSKAAKAIRAFATTIEQSPEVLIRGKGYSQP